MTKDNEMFIEFIEDIIESDDEEQVELLKHVFKVGMDTIELEHNNSNIKGA